MHSCLLRRCIFVFTIFLAATVAFTGCGKSSGGSSALLALLGGGGEDTLDAPQNVTASNGSFTDRVTVSWDAVDGATYYQVYRCDTEDGTYELISDNETATTYDDTDTLITDQNYYFKVKAFNGSSESEFSTFAVGKTGYEPLDTPLDVTATDGTQIEKITITWDTVDGATYYRVSRSTSQDSGYSVISGDETLTSYEDTTATPGTDYYYKVQAFNALQSSVLSDYSLGMAMLAAPEDVTATDGTHTDRTDISWTASAGAAHYIVYRSTNSSTGFSAISGEVADTDYSDESGTPGTDYYYRVKAVKGEVESDFSAYSLGMTGLAAPGGVIATDGTYTDRVEIEWSEVEGAHHYIVLRSTSADSGYSALAGEPTDPEYTDSTGAAGTDYYYKVKAVNGDNESPLSGYALGKIGTVPPPAAPANPSATQNTHTDKVTVSWDEVDDADYYNLFRADSSEGPYTTQIGGNITGLSQDDTTVVAGTHYYYKVKAINGNGASEFSASAEGWAQLVILPLDTPTGVSASDRTSTSTVTVTWGTVTDADYYRVYRALKSDGDYAQVGGNITGTSYGDTDTFEDLAYYYKVKAFDDVRGESAFSSADSGRCELTHLEYLLRFNINWEYMQTNLRTNESFPPSFIGTYNYDALGNSANPGTKGSDTNNKTHAKVVASLSKAVTTFTHYAYNDLGMVLGGAETTDIRNVTSTKDGTHVGTVTTTGTYNGTIVENLTVYNEKRNGGTFTVTYNGSDEVITFSETQGPNILLSVPGNMMATQGTVSGKVAITWPQVYGANRYRVYRATSINGTYSQLGSDITGSVIPTDGTVYSYEDTTGSTTHYFYKVRAVNNYLYNNNSKPVLSDYSAAAEGWGQ
jgi:fibronectin type 3 domain-containing protein